MWQVVPKVQPLDFGGAEDVTGWMDNLRVVQRCRGKGNFNILWPRLHKGEIAAAVFTEFPASLAVSANMLHGSGLQQIMQSLLSAADHNSIRKHPDRGDACICLAKRNLTPVGIVAGMVALWMALGPC